jgi:hypothetical protein
MREVWKIAFDFPDYEVSSLGRVRRITTVTRTTAGYILKAARHYGGYYQHGLGRDGKTVTVKLNRLVCLTFHGSPPTSEHVAAHKDDDPANNEATNLHWQTPLENEKQKSRNGRRRVGSRVKNAKLTEIDVKQKLDHGVQQTVLADTYQVSKGLIAHIAHGRAWTHVT